MTFWIITLTFFISASAIACPQSNCVRIGSWNIAWLGSDKRHQPADVKSIESMAALISDTLSIDVISLEEINTEMDGEYRGEFFSVAHWQLLQQSLRKRGYRFQTGSSGYAQHVVLAWRPPVMPIQIPNELPIPDAYTINENCHSSHLRKPLAGYFRAGKFDFWLTGVHLKANKGSSNCASLVRAAQITAMIHALRPLAAQDPDIVITGDFNADAHNKSLQPLFAEGYRSMDDPASRSTNSNDQSYINTHSSHDNDGSMLDHVIINPLATQEWQKHSTTFYKPNDSRQFLHTLSDHVPIWADFSTDRDDD